ncbi:RecQ family ATP-dependent DNA helicase [uncultured Proteiniphilum sp.]|uniref:RecQ family ATP-dependent DNA helicase n=1 Tax=uncultured Proteiniphilum sp. TaxID=497637 RepID=UPI002637F2C2|nr:RecQ family ATP-dependent DNA helicase [uncultured Proteiniphilum sp.]
MTRQQAEIQLQRLFGFRQFHDLQWQVIENLLAGKRVLFIEKTGFGKSLCYQFPATQLEGVTIVFTPLIALMRDQVRSMQKKGIRAAAINSNQKDEENTAIITDAQNNQLDILYIAPERMENATWINSAREMKIAMVVIDEAHCISMWGQSFRPNYRRIVNLVKLLPKSFPVLATTATATPRVQADIIEQVGTDLIPIRGQLMRSNIRLFVVPVQSEDEKFFWLAEYLPKLKKTGIVYTGTQANTDIFSNWLQFLGFYSAAYSGRLDAETRMRVETDFINNKFDCVVSTNALGMGIDKPDIRFIIHTQIPQSPIHYYQEIGRAGRDGQEAFAILLYNPHQDFELPQAFIDGSKPSADKYEQVIAVTKKELLGRNEIIKATNLRQTQVSVILADLIDQGIINEQQGRSKKYFYNPDAPVLNPSTFETLRDAQNQELKRMLEYTGIISCRMQYVCNYLGDEMQGACGVCDNDTNKKMRVVATEALTQKLQEFRETFFPVLEVETQRNNIINGVAASYYGVSNIGRALHHSKYEEGGDFPDWLLKLTLKAFRKYYGNTKFDLVLYVPPTESGDLVKNFAEKIASVLKIPISHKLVKTVVTLPQKVFQSGISKKENVYGKFTYQTPDEITGKSVLLIDDIFDSGYTIKEIGRYLTSIGATTIAPLVIAKTVGGDI